MRTVNGYRGMLAKCAATAVILACRGGAARAEEPVVAAPTGLLQQQMGSGFTSSGLTLRGYVEGGYAFSFAPPASTLLGYGYLFDEKSDDVTLNQIGIVFGRDVSKTYDHVDVGFMIQGIYGSDARFTQANGTNFYGSRTASDYDSTRLPSTFQVGTQTFVSPNAVFRNNPNRNSGQNGPQNELDVLQANVTLALPAWNGLLLTAGKFVTPWGMETVDPTQNLLYSHSFMYALATPKTLTGVTATARVNPDLSVMGGLVLGWDQSLHDNNDFPSAVAQAAYRFDEQTDGALSVMAGPERADNRSDFRWTVDATVRCSVSTETTLGFEGMLGYEPEVRTSFESGLGGLPIPPQIAPLLIPNANSAYWNGAAAYAEQKLDDGGRFTLIARGEYFNDNQGGRGLAAVIWSGTVGVRIVPFGESKIGRGLMIRPELRWDYSDQAIFDDVNRNAQFVASVDVTYAF